MSTMKKLFAVAIASAALIVPSAAPADSHDFCEPRMIIDMWSFYQAQIDAGSPRDEVIARYEETRAHIREECGIDIGPWTGG